MNAIKVKNEARKIMIQRETRRNYENYKEMHKAVIKLAEKIRNG